MTTVEDRPARERQPRRPTAADRPIGFGRIQRKEDPRFVRGKGHYLDDIVLPGMLHGAILRSPMAHARLVSIDTTEALAHPKVLAVITGKDLEGLNLAWAPTLSADVHGRARHRQGALPGPGGRLRRRRGPVLRPRRARAHRRRVRGPAGRHRRPPRPGPRRRGDPRRQGGPDRQPHLRLGGRRQGRDRRRLRARPTSSSARRSSTRGCTRRRWRPAARSPTTTRSTAS